MRFTKEKLAKLLRVLRGAVWKASPLREFGRTFGEMSAAIAVQAKSADAVVPLKTAHIARWLARTAKPHRMRRPGHARPLRQTPRRHCTFRGV